MDCRCRTGRGRNSAQNIGMTLLTGHPQSAYPLRISPQEWKKGEEETWRVEQVWWGIPTRGEGGRSPPLTVTWPAATNKHTHTLTRFFFIFGQHKTMATWQVVPYAGGTVQCSHSPLTLYPWHQGEVQHCLPHIMYSHLWPRPLTLHPLQQRKTKVPHPPPPNPVPGGFKNMHFFTLATSHITNRAK